jgi:hypothetical protein
MSNVNSIRPITVQSHETRSRIAEGDEADTPSLPAPASTVVGDDIFAALAVLLTQLHQNERKSARESQGVEDAAKDKEDAAEVQAMHDKANDLRSEGLVTGLAEIGAGVADILSAGCDASAARTDDKIVIADRKLGSAVFGGASKGLEGAGKIAGGIYRTAQAQDDANAKSHAASASTYDRASKRAHDEEMDARDATKKVMEWLKEMRSAQDAARNAAASYRG